MCLDSDDREDGAQSALYRTQEGNYVMTIRDRIFTRISELEITQKEFAIRTGIPETTVSDWKKKKTNPTAEKILVICKVLDVTPEWLLSGVETHGTRSNPSKIIAIDVRTEAGELLELFNSCDAAMQSRILGFAQALGRTKTGQE